MILRNSTQGVFNLMSLFMKITHFLKTCIFKTCLVLTTKSIKNLLTASKQVKAQLNIFWQKSLSILLTVPRHCTSSRCSYIILKTLSFNINKFILTTLHSDLFNVVFFSYKFFIIFQEQKKPKILRSCLRKNDIIVKFLTK